MQSIQKFIQPLFIRFFLFAVISFCGAQAFAQNISYTENNLDQSLRGNLNVDPSTLGMSFSVPLGNFPGRGASMPVTLSYSSKVWRVKHLFSWTQFTGVDQSDVNPKYGEYSVSGWTTNLDVPWLEYTGGAQPYDASGNSICTTCETSPDHGYFIERIAMHMPDGSTHELRKSDTPVNRYFNQGAPPLTGIYVSTDGSRMKYDADNAVLYLPDGARYLLNAPGGVQFIDRNGNTLVYNSSSKQWTDTNGRVINVVLDNTIASGQTQATQTVSLPGFGTATQQYTLVWKKLHVMLGYASESQMPYSGRENCFSRTTQTPYLYTSFASFEHPCGALFNPSVLAEITLPNGLKYTFSYNTFGEVTKVTLPTGGYYSYTYAEVPGLDFNNYSALYGQANRGVTQQRVCETASCTSGQELVWSYSATNNGTTFVASVTNPLGEKSERTLHTSAALTYYGFDDARSARAYDERSYSATNQMLRRSLTEWIYTGDPSYGPRDARPVKQVGIILDTGGDALTQTSTMSYDNDLNVTENKSYDYATVTASVGQTGAITSMPLGILLRTEESLFVVNDSGVPNAADYRARHLISLPSRTLIKNGSSVVVAAAEFKYDESDLPLLTYAGTIPGWNDPATTVRGNVTSTKRWNNFNGTTFDTYPSGSFITARAQYDQFGNVRKTWDGNNKVSETEYGDSFADGNNTRNTYAYATKTISPVPDTSGYYSSGTALTTFATYDFQSGKPTQSKDANNQITNFEYETGNALGRLKRAILPDGGEVKKTYNDVTGSLYILSETKQSATVWLKDETHFDALGRAWKTRHFEGGTQWSEQQTAFDSLGRAWKTANPYFPGASPDWTESKFDALGRVTEVKTPDGAKVTSVYSGTKVTVSDPANKTRRSETDALGRLKQVVEDPSGLNYATNYTYSTTGNLIKVDQGGQYRYFLYDSLSRLLRARNPEQNTNSNLNLTPPSDQSTGNTAWALKYVYDANGNLTNKVDPRNVTTSYGYDALNRNIWTSYTDGITPTLERHYDAATNGKGRFYYHVSFNLHPVSGYAYSRTVVNAYDSMGRITSQSQGLLNAAATQWYDYTATRTYDLAGHVTGQTYPSSRTVSYSYAASGRLNSFSGGIGDGVTRTYADTFSYNAAGQVTKERFGTTTNLYHNQAYNNRLQLVENRLGTSSTDPATWNRGALINYYSNQARTANNQWLNATDNNGNVTRAEHYVPTDDAISSYSIPFRDDYDYDALNRITLVSGQQRNTGGSWASVYGQGNSYDRWGNRTINQATTWGTNINNTLYTVDAATNRFTQLSYDLAGSITSDTGNTREYDGENRMKKAWGGSQWNYYVYDADGKRVRRIIGSTETWQVYGLEGELIAEYPVNGAASTPQKEYGYRSGQMLIVGGCDVVRWIVADHLGTPRMEVDPSGSLTTMRRHDYLPFGEELLVGMGNSSIRTTGMGYTADCVRQRFTGHERDSETGLDYAQARYVSSQQGRFTGTDPIYFQALMVTDPQRLNLYAYVRNNPLRFIDPYGEAIRLLGKTEEDRKEELRHLQESVGLEAGNYLYINPVEIKDKNGDVVGTEYYVGVYSNGPDGKGSAFGQINDAAGELAEVINDTKIVDFKVSSRAEYTFDEGKGVFFDRKVKIGSIEERRTPGATGHINGQLTVIVFDGYAGEIPGNLMEGGNPGNVYPGQITGHELGHARDIMTGRDPYTLKDADQGSLRFENKVIKLADPTAPKRLRER